MQKILLVLSVVSTQLADSHCHMSGCDFVSFGLIRNRLLVCSALPCYRIFDYSVQLGSRDVCLSAVA